MVTQSESVANFQLYATKEFEPCTPNLYTLKKITLPGYHPPDKVASTNKSLRNEMY